MQSGSEKLWMMNDGIINTTENVRLSLNQTICWTFIEYKNELIVALNTKKK